MIGQNNLLKKLNSYTVDTFPRSIIIFGERGSGKHLITEYIRDNIIKFPMIDATDTLSDEYIDQIYRNPSPCIYLINMEAMMEKAQNILLKLIEEPLNNTFVILLCENKNNLLNTVENRCITFNMDLYSDEELYSFIKDPANQSLMVKALRTPGKIMDCQHNDWQALQDLCDKIVNKLSMANLGNTLSIASKINYKDEYDKFDFDIFLDFLVFTLYNKYLSDACENTFQLYLELVNARKKLIDKRINKQIWLENTLTHLWRMTH